MQDNEHILVYTAKHLEESRAASYLHTDTKVYMYTMVFWPCILLGKELLILSPQPRMVTSDPKSNKIYRCDDKCSMYKGISLCSHAIAAAEDNGDLKLFSENVCNSCTPNLSAIAK